MTTSKQNKGLILVTGCSTGIGRATALRLAHEGYRVFAGVRRQADGRGLEEEVLSTDASGTLAPILLDVTRDADVEAAVARVREVSAGEGLVALVNNAGRNLVAPFEHTDPADAAHLMAVNLMGPLALARALLPDLARAASRRRTAKIVNVGSVGSHFGLPWEAWYHASKFALLGIGEGLRAELYAQNVRVTTICPGGIRTPFIGATGAQAQAAIAALPPERRETYAAGLAAFARTAGAVDRLGSPPERVATAILRVVERRDPPARVLVGPDAHLLHGLKRWLPEAVHGALVRALLAPRARPADVAGGVPNDARPLTPP
ncbi:SDR family NAD(P)-dependent oxidoreductase [Salinarimonas sp.]|uniref:SDR family NAD(P)-dependent oxidoreductase n=1 Tax=Salinarimonas sp. TaxID=2766526 RepID=UPI00391AEBDC